MEQLEDRQLMAGNVTAGMSDGILFLSEAAGHQGAAQAVRVSQVNGRIQIDGLMTASGQTKINGSTRVTFALPSTLSVNLGGGNDKVDVRNVSIRNINIGTAAIPGALVSDNDQVNIDGVTLAGTLTVRTGVGQDNVNVTRSRIGNSVAGSGNVNIFTSAAEAAGETDKDLVFMFGVNVRGKTHIETGASADTVEVQKSVLGDAADDVVEVFTGAGADAVHFGPLSGDLDFGVSAAGNLDIRMMQSLTSISDADVDIVLLRDTTARENIYVKLGAGNDQLEMENVTAFQTILLEGQGGNDTMKLVDVEAANGFFASLGDGDDILDLTGLRTNRMGIVGGAGFDRLFRFASSFIPSTSLTITGIEEINGVRQGISSRG